jgi:hypothetical protein
VVGREGKGEGDNAHAAPFAAVFDHRRHGPLVLSWAAGLSARSSKWREDYAMVNLGCA